MTEYLKRLEAFKLLSKGDQSSPLQSKTESIRTDGIFEAAMHNQLENSQIKESSEVCEIELRKTIIRKVPLKRLVWAPCHNFKGGKSYLCSRVCDVGEGATEFIEDGKWPMKEDEDLVEYFNVPTTFPKLRVVSRKNLFPYYENPYAKKLLSPTKKSEDDDIAEGDSVWNEDAINELTTVLKRRYVIKVAHDVKSAMIKSANEYLRLAIEYENEMKSANNENCTPHEKEDDGHRNIRNIQVPEPEVDISSIISRSKKETPLSVGDSIEYFHKVFRNKRVKSVIANISTDSTSLKLEDGTILEAFDLISRGSDSGAVKDFKLIFNPTTDKPVERKLTSERSKKSRR